ncbi:hypothetical protein HD806DRAFT_528398 [Xylariaceae sp. AK1471]|nr:hypothetical protein HD806DRAFT_528398 [Xylariaceae sp. AK1471]
MATKRIHLSLFMRCESMCPESLAGDAVKFMSDDEGSDERSTTEKSYKSFKSSGDMSSMLMNPPGTLCKEQRPMLSRECRKPGAESNDETPQYTYLCGSWFPEARDLLWEQIDAGLRVRAEAMPAWFWALIGAPITTETGDEIQSGLAAR